MGTLAKPVGLLLIIGVFMTFASAANFTCPPVPLNETLLCATITPSVNESSRCTPTFQQYACSSSSALDTVGNDILANLSSCYNNTILQTLDPIYATLFFSKMNSTRTSALFDQLNSTFPTLNPEWRKYLLFGIWPQLNLSNPVPSNIQPFFSHVTPEMVMCLPRQNVTCAGFREVVRNLDAVFPNIPDAARKLLYSPLKSFLSTQKYASGSACSQNLNSSDWISQNLAKFAQFADFNDFTGLYSNFSALDALPLLSTAQIAFFSVDFNPQNNTAAIGNILAKFSDANGINDFLSSLNAAAQMKNVSMVQPSLSQGLLNKTFQYLLASTSAWNSSDWSQLFQNKIRMFLPEITPQQLGLIPQNVSCDSYQAIVGGLDSKFQQMAPGNQQGVFSAFIQPFLQKQGPACSPKSNSSFLLKQNMGQFSKYASYSDLLSLGGNFSAADVITSLTGSQIGGFAVDINSSNNAAAIANIVAALSNVNTVSDFLQSMSATAMQKNITSLPPPLAQALMNKTFDALRPILPGYGSSDWMKLQNFLSPILQEITPDQLNVIPQNLSCDSFQAIVKGLDKSFKQMSAGKPETVYKSFLKPFLGKQGPACSQNLSSASLLSQNYGQFSQFADYSDFLNLNSSFSAVSVLPQLTVSQKVGFSFVGNLTDAATIVGSLQNANDFQDFLNQFNTVAGQKNISAVQPNVSQAMLTKTFGLLNISALNNSDWAQLFQNKISLFVSEITPQQISFIPQSINCDAYKAIVGSLDSNFQKISPGNQQAIFQNLIQPYVKNQGPSCFQGGNGTTGLKQNFGQFFKYANYSDIVGLGPNFNPLDILPSLTIPQLVDFTFNTTINPVVASSIAANLKAPSDVKDFLNRFKTNLPPNGPVNPALSRALLSQTFQVLQPTFNNFTSTDWGQLFNGQISNFLPEITSAQLKLVPKSIGCDSFQLMVKSMDSNFAQMSTANQQGVYKDFIKPYLASKDKPANTIICYNQSLANSSAWLVTNMASFMSYTSEEDLTQCADLNTLQTFANDSSSLNLASQLKLTSDAGNYYTTLLTSNPNTNITGLPNAFLCFLNADALKKLSGADAQTLLPRINAKCFNASTSTTSTPSAKDLQVATALVSKITSFSSSDIANLGQSAVGLSTGQINKISDTDLKSSVSSLASVNGWNDGQARSIVARLLNANFSISNLTSLGSLVSGLPSKALSNLPQAAVLSAAKDPQFVSKLAAAPPTLQNQFVQQLMTGASNASSLVSNVPASLVAFIPASKLLSKSTKLSLSDVNNKYWTAIQAAFFFDDVLLTTTNYTDMSASVLQGFTCGTPNKIDNDKLRNLTKAMKVQNAVLSEDQLTCLSRQVIKNGYPSDLDQYPKEIFLYFNATAYAISTNATCKDYYTTVGAANVTILQKGASLRKTLLSQALTCLNVTGYALTSAHAQVLGLLVCDLNSTYIDNSYPDLVIAMTKCKSFTVDQQTSILKALSKGNSTFGLPSSWSKDTLNSLGAMSGLLSKDILTSVTKVSLYSWLSDAISNNLLTRSQFTNIIQIIASTRARRATGCTSGNITADNVNDNLLPLTYTASQLDACLDNDVLVNYLQVLTSKPFTTDQLYVLKNKLDAVYASGYPESILPSLGGIAFLCTDNDISKWNMTTVDTLQGLMASGPPSNVTMSIVTRYINLGNVLTTSAINVLGSNICLLTSAQVDTITYSNLGDAKPVDISSCSQTLKDSLYGKLKTYATQQTNDTTAYYNLIKPYLGGAPAADLKTLASNNPNMDIGTFTTLNPAAVTGLSVSDVKSLLGNNTADLATQLSNPVVNAWVSSQKQTDLDTLGLNITGGIKDVTTQATTTIKATSSAPAFTQGLTFILTIVAATFIFS